jgi:tetratricopeptide (TPR) repeat protein/DNA-binding winged helix-turn-helix (wHTH) protein
VLAHESGQVISLTRGEFALLRMFVTRPGRVISRDTLLDAFTNRRFEPFDRSIDVLIGRLRRKIEPDPKQPRLVVTVPGEGYRFDGLTHSLPSDKGTAADVRQIGRELNVRYVLEGSVQRGGNRMRVNVQLLEAQTASHIWAERFDKPVADLFDMQDEIVARLAGALDAQLAGAEARRAEQAPSPDSTDLYFQGLASLNKSLTPGHVAQARSLFDRAITADPSNVDALVGSAVADVREGANSFATNPSVVFAAAEAKLSKALSSVPDHARGHMWLGLVDIWTRRAAQGIAESEHALVLDRNLAHAHSIIRRAKVFVGRAEETEAHVAEALRLSPRDTVAYIWMYFAGLAKLHLGKYEQAIAWFRRAIEANRNYPAANFNLAAALAQLGRLDEARSAVTAGLALNPDFTVSRAGAALTARSDDRTYLAQLEPILEGMRQAGIPEE